VRGEVETRVFELHDKKTFRRKLFDKRLAHHRFAAADFAGQHAEQHGFLEDQVLEAGKSFDVLAALEEKPGVAGRLKRLGLRQIGFSRGFLQHLVQVVVCHLFIERFHGFRGLTFAYFYAMSKDFDLTDLPSVAGPRQGPNTGLRSGLRPVSR
jgi:hypothetical protein